MDVQEEIVDNFSSEEEENILLKIHQKYQKKNLKMKLYYAIKRLNKEPYNLS